MSEVVTTKPIHPAHFLPGKGLRFLGPDEDGNTVIRSVTLEDGSESVTQAALDQAEADYVYDEARVKAETNAATAAADQRGQRREQGQARIEALRQKPTWTSQEQREVLLYLVDRVT